MIGRAIDRTFPIIEIPPIPTKFSEQEIGVPVGPARSLAEQAEMFVRNCKKIPRGLQFGIDFFHVDSTQVVNYEDGFLIGKQYLIMDRDTKFCESFRAFLANEGVKPVRLPPRSPNMNAHLDRFFGSLKSECLNRLILFGEQATRNAVAQYLTHYHRARNHQGLENELIESPSHPVDIRMKIETIDRLLRSYRRAA